MSDIPADLRYTPEHEWVRRAGDDTVRVGITDFAQSSLGDVVYVQLPEVGTAVTAGESFGEVESTKSVSDLYAPVSATVVAVNGDLEANPQPIRTVRAGCWNCAATRPAWTRAWPACSMRRATARRLTSSVAVPTC